MAFWKRAVFLIETPQDPQWVLETLRRHTAGAQDRFWGEIPRTPGEAWQLHPVSRRRNDFLPVLHCTLLKTPQGCRLRVVGRQSRRTRIFLALWFGLLCCFFAAAAAGGSGEGAAVLALMGLLGWGVVRSGFWGPMDRAREDLCALVQGTVPEYGDFP